MFFFTFHLSAQVQLGSDLYGASGGQQFGRSIALSSDGSRLVIGAFLNNDNGINAGQVTVYEFSNNEWQLVGNPIFGEAGDKAGRKVAISGDGTRIAVGFPDYDSYGKIQLFDFDGEEWMPVGSPLIGADSLSEIGQVMVMSSDGKRIALGSRDSSMDDIVAVYHFDETSWMSLGSTLMGGDAGIDVERLSLSADGNRIAIGLPGDNPNGNTASGSARVFQYNGTDWEQLGATWTGNLGDRLGFGVSLSADGNRIAIGSPGDEAIRGKVMTYEFDGSVWSSYSNNAMKGLDEDHGFGSSVSLSADGTRILVGEPYDDSLEPNGGSARIFNFNGDVWVATENLLFADIDDNDSFFGWTVALSADGSRGAVYGWNNGITSSAGGIVKVYGEIPVDVLEIEEETIQVFPNPTSGLIQVQGFQFNQLDIFDHQGRLLRSIIITVNEIDMSEFAPGMYFLKAYQGEKIYNGKIIKH